MVRFAGIYYVNCASNTKNHNIYADGMQYYTLSVEIWYRLIYQFPLVLYPEFGMNHQLVPMNQRYQIVKYTALRLQKLPGFMLHLHDILFVYL